MIKMSQLIDIETNNNIYISLSQCLDLNTIRIHPMV